MVRPPLSEKRLSLVRRAFTTLDTNGDGALDIPTVAGSYNALQHPEVLNGKLTARQALALFLDTFDAGGEIEGKVTKNEFITYYTNVGKSIEPFICCYFSQIDFIVLFLPSELTTKSSFSSHHSTPITTF